MASGWHKEYVRHSLAARGIPSGKYNRKYLANVNNVPFKFKATSEIFKKEGGTSFKFGVPGSTPKEKSEKGAPEGTFAETVQKKTQEVLQRLGSRGTALPTSTTKRIVGAQQLDAVSTELIRSQRPVDSALASASGGNVGDALVLLANKSYKDAQGITKQLTSDEAEALQSALNVRAITLASAGEPVPDGIMDKLDKSVRKRVKLLEEGKARELESPFRTVLREEEKKFAVATLDAPGVAVSGVAGATVEGLGALGRAGFAKSDKQFKGVVGEVDELEQSPFFKNNAVIGSEEDGAFGMKTPPRLGAGFDFLDAPEGASNNVVFQNLDKNKTFSENVQEKVDSLYTGRAQFAKTDVQAFGQGDKAFKEGNREGVIVAIAELQSQEALLKDKWNFVSKTHAQMMSNENSESAHKKSDATLGVLFNTGGARQLADQAEKLNDVRGELVKSNNHVAGRRKMLEFRLQRLDTEVPPETSLPTKKVQVFNDDFGMKQFLGNVDNPVFENG